MTTTELNKDGFPKGGRPTTVPLRLEGKWRYCRLGRQLIKYPADVDPKDEMEILIKMINNSYDRNIVATLSADQNSQLDRFIRNHCSVLA